MKMDNAAYDAALAIVEKAVERFAVGDIDGGDELLAGLDRAAIERDRVEQLRLARTARTIVEETVQRLDTRSISADIKEFVRQRDRYNCRFTGRRLIDTEVFRECARISRHFHFDEHHSVNQTRRGPGGHPIVRTHGAAYEHATPLSLGGATSRENIFHISVQLNEAKGAKVLDLIPVADGTWDGLRNSLAALRKQPSSQKVLAKRDAVEKQEELSGELHRRERMSPQSPMLDAATDPAITIFSHSRDNADEAAFGVLRTSRKNAFFATERQGGEWMLHRMYCSSLAFTVPRLLTTSPKVYAERQEPLREWARQIGVELATCSRCRKAK